MAHLSGDLKSVLMELLNPSSTIGKPDGYIDMTASVTEQLHYDVLRLLLQDRGIDGIIFLTSPPGFTDEKKLAEAIISAYQSFPEEARKPLLSVMLSGAAVGTCRSMLEAADLPTCEYPDDAARVMANLIRDSQYRARKGRRVGGAAGASLRVRGALHVNCRPIIGKALSSGRVLLPEHEAYRICESFGIPSPPTRFATDYSGLAKEAELLGYPVVLKIASPDIVHKSDVGGVVVGISFPSGLKREYARMMKAVRQKAGDVRIDGVLVQKVMPRGVEVVVGGIRNAQFGPVVMFGFGGILVEVFKDVSFRLAPLDRAEAVRQIRETKRSEEHTSELQSLS
jgi:acyl-CoA synthetase (NDP forming)